MQARDIMTVNVATVRPETEVTEVAKQLLARHISAMPVVVDRDKVVGIVSEGDLMRRSENETERPPPWWRHIFAEPQERARDYVESHGRHAEDVMTRNVISVSEETPLAQVAETFEKHEVKRVPVIRDGKLVGIVSRADLLQGIVAGDTQTVATATGRNLKKTIQARMDAAGLNAQYINIVVDDGSVALYGTVETKAEKSALGIAAEEVAGAGRVDNQLDVMPALVRTTIGSQ